MTVRISGMARGTRVVVGEEAEAMTTWLSKASQFAQEVGFIRVYLPCLVLAECYAGAPGERMVVQGPSAETVLAPERTDQARRLARDVYAQQRDVHIFYIERCFRLERPQAGRWREFTQFGMEILWPTNEDRAMALCQSWATSLTLMAGISGQTQMVVGVDRGASYYRDGLGFEILGPASMGAQRQLAGGGVYAEGVGFAIGVERLMLATGGVA